MVRWLENRIISCVFVYNTFGREGRGGEHGGLAPSSPPLLDATAAVALDEKKLDLQRANGDVAVLAGGPPVTLLERGAIFDRFTLQLAPCGCGRQCEWLKTCDSPTPASIDSALIRVFRILSPSSRSFGPHVTTSGKSGLRPWEHHSGALVADK